MTFINLRNSITIFLLSVNCRACSNCVKCAKMKMTFLCLWWLQHICQGCDYRTLKTDIKANSVSSAWYEPIYFQEIYHKRTHTHTHARAWRLWWDFQDLFYFVVLASFEYNEVIWSLRGMSRLSFKVIVRLRTTLSLSVNWWEIEIHMHPSANTHAYKYSIFSRIQNDL